MCGIAGHIGFTSVSDNVIEKMTSALRHRGPDVQSVFRDSDLPVQLGHARLSIIDLSPAGEQPMHSETKRFTIVFNGEIYNHQALRKELEIETKLHWRGSSDTETLIACIEIWGMEKTLHAVHGMFAFALLDRNTNSITISRDRFGEKPLYYSCDEEGIYFASELGSILKFPKCSKTPCITAAKQLLSHQAISAPFSALENVYTLLPGTWLTYSLDGAIASERWWCAEHWREHALKSPFLGDFNEAQDELKIVLGDAVSRQMISDVALGAFLSGGIDSSTIVSLMQANSSKPINTFSIGFENAEYNEANEAKQVAKILGTNHTETYITDNDITSIAHSLGEIFSEPLADPSQIPTALVSKIAKEKVTVALTGDAGDEVFGGYNRHVFASTKWPLIRTIPVSLRKAAVGAVQSVPESTFNAFANNLPITKHWTRPYEMLQRVGATLSAADLNELYQNAVTKSHKSLLSTDILTQSASCSGCPQIKLIDNLPSSNYKDNPADWMMLMDQSNYLRNDILAKVDRASMAYSLETRVPFLDQEVVRFAWSLPPEFRIKDKQGKYILKKLLNEYVPSELIDRAKMGFDIPIHDLLRGPLRPWASELLESAAIEDSGLFDSAKKKTHVVVRAVSKGAKGGA